MPAANQPPAGAARISSTGVLHEAEGAGDSTSLIVKLPSAERSTGLVLRSVKGAAFSQTSVAKTCRVAVPPDGVTTSAVPVVLPPENKRPLPVTLMRPSAFTSATRSAITHGEPAGCTPRTMLRLTVVAVASVPTPLETPSTPIPPLNLTSESSARPSDGASETRIATSVTIFILYSSYGWCSSRSLHEACQHPRVTPIPVI